MKQRKADCSAALRSLGRSVCSICFRASDGRGSVSHLQRYMFFVVARPLVPFLYLHTEIYARLGRGNRDGTGGENKRTRHWMGHSLRRRVGECCGANIIARHPPSVRNNCAECATKMLRRMRFLSFHCEFSPPECENLPAFALFAPRRLGKTSNKF